MIALFDPDGALPEGGRRQANSRPHRVTIGASKAARKRPGEGPMGNLVRQVHAVTGIRPASRAASFPAGTDYLRITAPSESQVSLLSSYPLCDC
jgi:hypothetical protein